LHYLTEGAHSSTTRARRELVKLATLVARYTIQMSSDECGGLSEYVEYFSALRKVKRIPELSHSSSFFQIFSIRNQRDELDNEVRNVLSIVGESLPPFMLSLSSLLTGTPETNFDDEQQRLKYLAKVEDNRRDERRRRFEDFLTVVGAITLPIVLISGIFGMNNEDLPISVSFGLLMGLSVVASLLLLILFAVISHHLTVKDNRKRKALEQLRRDTIGLYGEANDFIKSVQGIVDSSSSSLER